VTSLNDDLISRILASRFGTCSLKVFITIAASDYEITATNRKLKEKGKMCYIYHNNIN